MFKRTYLFWFTEALHNFERVTVRRPEEDDIRESRMSSDEHSDSLCRYFYPSL